MRVDTLPALLAALGALIVPPVLGWVVGRRLPAWARPIAVLAVALGPTALAVATSLPLGDVVLASGLAGVGVACGRLDARRAARLAAQLLVAAVLAEGLGRVALPTPPRFPDRGWSPARVTDGDAATACRLLFAEPDALAGELARRGAGGRPATLHVGDSLLVFGSTGAAPGAERLPGRLAALDPGRDHVNLGVPGTATDLQALLATRFARSPVDRVVLWFFPKNDLNELDRRYPCCRGRPLVEVDDGVPHPSCPVPDPPLLGLPALDRALLDSPTPLPIAALSTRSAVVAHLRARATVALAYGTAWPAGYEGADLDASRLDEAPRWARVEAILRALRDDLGARGIGLTVVALPHGQEIVAALGLDAVSHRRARTLGDLCARLGIPFVAADDLLPEGPGARRWFLGDDIHLTDEGHAELARRLAPSLLSPAASEAPETRRATVPVGGRRPGAEGGAEKRN